MASAVLDFLADQGIFSRLGKSDQDILVTGMSQDILDAHNPRLLWHKVTQWDSELKKLSPARSSSLEFTADYIDRYYKHHELSC
jgi:hypothetical protein